jgi:hypothetical protein
MKSNKKNLVLKVLQVSEEPLSDIEIDITAISETNADL